MDAPSIIFAAAALDRLSKPRHPPAWLGRPRIFVGALSIASGSKLNETEAGLAGTLDPSGTS